MHLERPISSGKLRWADDDDEVDNYYSKCNLIYGFHRSPCGDGLKIRRVIIPLLNTAYVSQDSNYAKF